MMRGRWFAGLLLSFGLFFMSLAACNLAPEPQDTEPLATATGLGSSRPQVTIVSPQNGAEVVLNDEVLISATATDSIGVQRVQLLADGQIVKTVSSESPSGDRSLNVLLDYTPRREGEVNLQVIAYRGAVAGEPAPLRLVVRERQEEVVATQRPVQNVPVIDPNDPTCRVLINVGLNLRSGPGTTFNVITVLSPGAVVPIIGRTAVNDWWQVRSNTQTGWVSAEFTTVYGNCGSIPVQQNPATQTAAPTLPPAPTFTSVPAATATNSPADLYIANVSGPTTLTLSGSEVSGTYAVTLTNVGGRTSSQFNNVVVRTPGNVEIPLGVVSSLGPNESIVLTVEITFGAAGEFSLQARADAANNLTEVNESNNSAFYSVTVRN